MAGWWSAWPLTWRVVSVYLILLAVIVAAMLATRNWWSAVQVTVVGFLIVMAEVRARTGYRHGWYQGRNQLLASMTEAHRRGMSAQDWMRAEVDREP